MEIRNAMITSTKLGREDHDILTFCIHIRFGGGTCCGVGCYALDYYDTKKQEKVFYARGMELISEILDVVGVNDWEDLKGKYIRIKDNGYNSTIDEIGNLLEDKWLNFKEFFSEDNKEE